jgi:hypothetical protein
MDEHLDAHASGHEALENREPDRLSTNKPLGAPDRASSVERLIRRRRLRWRRRRRDLDRGRIACPVAHAVYDANGHRPGARRGSGGCGGDAAGA